MVIMDMETYGRREEDLAIAERLLLAERTRLAGAQGYSISEFESNMRQAIRKGAAAHDCALIRTFPGTWTNML